MARASYNKEAVHTCSACWRELAAVTVHLPVGKILTKTLLLDSLRQSCSPQRQAPPPLEAQPILTDGAATPGRTRAQGSAGPAVLGEDAR